MKVQTILQIIIVIVAFEGFLIASYIRHKKIKKTPLVCPMRTNCDTVIHSDYSKILGIPVEILGIMYYAFVFTAHSIQIIHPELITPNFVILELSISAAAFLFSMYLTSIQAFVLKQWCTWCLISATFCLVIFFFTYNS